MFIIKRGDEYVAKPAERSYTKNLKLARTWPTREAAARERCSDETITTVEAEIGVW